MFNVYCFFLYRVVSLHSRQNFIMLLKQHPSPHLPIHIFLSDDSHNKLFSIFWICQSLFYLCSFAPPASTQNAVPLPASTNTPYTPTQFVRPSLTATSRLPDGRLATVLPQVRQPFVHEAISILTPP